MIILYRKLSLFFSLIWRQIEPPSCGIPDPYRIKGRISAGAAWGIANQIWGKEEDD